LLLPRLERILLDKPLTARRAAFAIAWATLAVTVASGILVHFLDRKDFENVWIGLWWAAQTVTTVGYGDVTPHTASGRVVATLVMLTGIGFLTVITAAITAALVESARRRFGAGRDAGIEGKLDELSERLARLEALLGSADARTGPPGPPR
jgi:voltage-gated potassium channel